MLNCLFIFRGFIRNNSDDLNARIHQRATSTAVFSSSSKCTASTTRSSVSSTGSTTACNSKVYFWKYSFSMTLNVRLLDVSFVGWSVCYNILKGAEGYTSILLFQLYYISCESSLWINDLKSFPCQIIYGNSLLTQRKLCVIILCW